jgi:hypothetical protein
MIGMEAMGIEALPAREVLSHYEPDILNHEIYMKGFERFERIYETSKEELTNEAIPLLQMQLK